MRPKDNCEECGNLGQANALRISQVDFRKLCYRCFSSECYVTKQAKLSSMDKDNYEMAKLYKTDRKAAKVLRMLKHKIVLVRGEDKVLINAE